jgi:hypothetical protein
MDILHFVASRREATKCTFKIVGISKIIVPLWRV